MSKLNSLTNNSAKIQQIDYPRILVTVNRIWKEIYDRHDHSLDSIINSCETNIQHLINKVMGIRGYESKGKKFDGDLMLNITPIVFGDINGLQKIFDNILDNKFLKCTDVENIKYKIELNKEDQQIITYFMDDGILPNPLKKGQGIDICKDEAKKYFGDFELRAINKNDQFAEKGYSTVAILKLNYTYIKR